MVFLMKHLQKGAIMFRFFARFDMAEGFEFLNIEDAKEAGHLFSYYENGNAVHHEEKIRRICAAHGFDFSSLECAPLSDGSEYYFGHIVRNERREVFAPLYVVSLGFCWHHCDKTHKLAFFEVGNDTPLKIVSY